MSDEDLICLAIKQKCFNDFLLLCWFFFCCEWSNSKIKSTYIWVCIWYKKLLNRLVSGEYVEIEKCESEKLGLWLTQVKCQTKFVNLFDGPNPLCWSAFWMRMRNYCWKKCLHSITIRLAMTSMKNEKWKTKNKIKLCAKMAIVLPSMYFIGQNWLWFS